MGWRILLWLILVLASIVSLMCLMPVGILIRYSRNVLKSWVSIGPFRIPLKLGKTKETHTKENSKKNIRTLFNEPIKANREYDNLLGDFLAEIKTFIQLFGYLRPQIRINRLILNLHIAAKHPAMAAMLYGGAWAALGAVVPVLSEAFTIRKKELDVDCDFSNDTTTLDGELDLSIGLARLLWCLLRFVMNNSDKVKMIHMERRQ